MKYTINEIKNMITKVNKAKGIEQPAYNVIGSIRLYQAYGAYAVDEVVNVHGGVKRLYGLGTKNEIGAYLSGFID